MMTATRSIRTRADLHGRQALVLGLARSGVAAARFLSDAGAVVTAYDRRDVEALADAARSLGERPIRLALGVPQELAFELIQGADLLVSSPSISPRFPTTEPWLRDALRAAEARGVELISEIELFLRLTDARILAVTGTKGKTTTTALLGAILDAAEIAHVVGGNIGEPLVERSQELDSDTWAVLELSELQLPTISRGADIAVYTNITADHLDRHGSLDAYRAVKARLAELTVSGGGTVVLNADDAGCRDLGRALRGDLHWYALSSPGSGEPVAEAHEADGQLMVSGAVLMSDDEVPLPGAHMRSNVLAAALAAYLAGASRDAIADGIRGFRGVPHRLETIADRDGIRWVNDSQATIPVAAIAALEAFSPAPVVLIAGGQGKGLTYAAFAEAVAKRARVAILIGETADELARLLAGRVEVERASSMDEAVSLAGLAARTGDVVLLSPAAASFDMFTDYAARGDAFREAVARVAPSGGATRP